MQRAKARALVAVLNAAYPLVALEPETIDVYAGVIARLESETAAVQAIDRIIESSVSWPAIAEIRRTYQSIRGRELAEAARLRGLEESKEREPIPPEVKAQMQRMFAGIEERSKELKAGA